MRLEAVLSTFTALLVLLDWDPQGAHAEILIFQSPSILTVKEGADATLNCSFDTSLEISEAAVDWKKTNDTVFSCVVKKLHHIENCKNHTNGISINWNSGFFTLHINGTQLSDNGTYYCHLQIERPIPIKRGQGNGTVLIVEASGDAPLEFYTDREWMMMVAWLISGILLCVLATIIFIVKDRRLTSVYIRSGSESQEAGGTDEPCDLPSEHEKVAGESQQSLGREAFKSVMMKVQNNYVPVRVRQASAGSLTMDGPESIEILCFSP
ncbi:uncharacterized protein LOC125487770 [Rhincodon typus]|uniref:uncharacterized protein LOC125487770 n=1 Tax=Rhincodon typus TaxID=259920 RepID=UPI00202E38D6|nr:uncharacterized protein LOC125487770 [Rhincodon typus]